MRPLNLPGGLREARVLLLLWLASAVVWVSGCHQEQPPLRVGTYPWLGFSTLHQARALGLFGEGNVELVDFASAKEVMGAFADGVIDAAGLTLDETLRLLYMGKVGSVVLVFGHSKGGDSLVARPGISSIGDLRGRRVGVEAGTEGDYLLARILAEGGLQRADVQVVEIDLDGHEDAYLGGKLDALVTMNPVRARLLGLGAHELYSSKEIEGELVDVLLVRESVLASQPENLRKLVAAHFRALDSMREDPMAAALRLPPRFGSPSNVLSGWNLVEFSGSGANLRLLGNGDLLQVALRVEKFMRQHGLVNSARVEPLKLDDRFVRGSP